MAIEVDMNFAGAQAQLAAAAHSLISDTASTMQGEAQRLAPVDTGALRRSIRTVPTPDGAEVVAEEPYAVFVEFGTGVYAKGGRKTPWVYTPDGGKHFYITSGQRAQPYMRPAYQAARAYLETEGRRRFG